MRAVSALGLFITLCTLAIFEPAIAHDHSRPELDHWFMSLQSKGKSPCCDGSDATRLDDVDWESRDGHYRVRLAGEWVDVPDSAVVNGPRWSDNGLAVLRERGDARSSLLHAGEYDLVLLSQKAAVSGV